MSINLKLKRGDNMKYKCKDKHNSWEMNILKNWEKSYNAILKGTIYQIHFAICL